MTFAPDGRLFVSRHGGKLHVLEIGQLHVLDVRARALSVIADPTAPARRYTVDTTAPQVSVTS